MSAPSPPPLYMDAVIRPQRSMSKAGLGVLIGVVAFMNLVVGGFFFLVIHAPVVPIFLGLDVLLVCVAFRMNNRAARRAEHVTVTAERIEVTEEGLGPPRTLWASTTAFTRVAIDDLGEDEWRVRLQRSGKVLTLARALAPEQRRDFGLRLEDAIRAARAERYVS